MTRRLSRRRAINLLIVAAICAAYISYNYFTTASTTALSWVFLIAVLVAAMHSSALQPITLYRSSTR